VKLALRCKPHSFELDVYAKRNVTDLSKFQSLLNASDLATLRYSALLNEYAGQNYKHLLGESDHLRVDAFTERAHALAASAGFVATSIQITNLKQD
jgi:hypothetical protein